jgi:hypothetical protein
MPPKGRKFQLFPDEAQMAWFQVEEEGEEEKKKEERKKEKRDTTVPPLSTTSLAQTLDRYSATLLNIIMLMFGKCGWPEKGEGMRNIIVE